MRIVKSFNPGFQTDYRCQRHRFAVYNTNLPLHTGEITRSYWDLPRERGSRTREKIAIRMRPMSITWPRVMRFVSKHVLLPVPFESRRIALRTKVRLELWIHFQDRENFTKSRFFRKFLLYQLERKELFFITYYFVPCKMNLFVSVGSINFIERNVKVFKI